MKSLFQAMLALAVVSMQAGIAAPQSAPSADFATAHIVVSGTASSLIGDWYDIAVATIYQPPNLKGTSEEQLPILPYDLATVQIAVYDAVTAIDGTHRPFAVTVKSPIEGASKEAAAVEASYRALKGLFPSRIAGVQPAYDKFMASLHDGTAKSRGIAIGDEAAVGALASRAADGRLTPPPPYAPSTAPGRYRGADPVGRILLNVKPFALTSYLQFVAPGPPSLQSATYTTDFEETRLLGAKESRIRTASQTEIARFHSESPPEFWPRNVRAFAGVGTDIAGQARLMAMIWVTDADATGACFASKYKYDTWRPQSAIRLADTDGNDATHADASWESSVPTPSDPEYPATHACAIAALAETLSEFLGTADVAFDFTSKVTGTTRHFETVDALVDEAMLARVAGGMHFRTSTVDGAALGRTVAHWELTHHFQPLN